MTHIVDSDAASSSDAPADGPDTEVRSLLVDAEGKGERFDMYLATQLTGVNRTWARRLIEEGVATLNGVEARPSARLAVGDVLALPTQLPPQQIVKPTPEEIAFDVIYEERDFLVLVKPPGLVVHPAKGHLAGTLVNALVARYPELLEVESERPGIVQRLDKDTSGLMIIARNQETTTYFQEQLRDRRVLKEYAALCVGVLDPPTGTIEAPIGRHPSNRYRMAVVSTGRDATTRYETVQVHDGYTLAQSDRDRSHTPDTRPPLGYRPPDRRRRAVWATCRGARRQFLHAARLGLDALRRIRVAQPAARSQSCSNALALIPQTRSSWTALSRKSRHRPTWT
ncbi:MAG: RluA family pseudouridine synthase [Chloroflexia bacterium]